MKYSFKAARPEGYLSQCFRQVLGRAELKPATGNVGILSGSLWEMGDKQEEGNWGSQGFAERGHGWCRGMWVNTTLASMHSSRTSRLLTVLQFAPHHPQEGPHTPAGCRCPGNSGAAL